MKSSCVGGGIACVAYLAHWLKDLWIGCQDTWIKLSRQYSIQTKDLYDFGCLTLNVKIQVLPHLDYFPIRKLAQINSPWWVKHILSPLPGVYGQLAALQAKWLHPRSWALWTGLHWDPNRVPYDASKNKTEWHPWATAVGWDPMENWSDASKRCLAWQTTIGNRLPTDRFQIRSCMPGWETHEDPIIPHILERGERGLTLAEDWNMVRHFTVRVF